MSDIIDAANDQAELVLSVELSYRRPNGPKPTGRCLWCGEDVAPDRRWCDSDCRDQFERYAK